MFAEVIFSLIGLGGGMALSWAFWGRYRSGGSKGTEEALKEENVRLETIIEIKESVLKELQQKAEIAHEKMLNLSATLAATEKENELLKRQFSDWKGEVVDMQKTFSVQFEQIAGRVLEEKSKVVSAYHQQSIEGVLSPLKERIHAFEEKVQRVYDQEAAERNMLKGEIKQLMELNRQMHNDALNLTQALKGDSRVQGVWGEFVLERLLEKSGLTKNREYRMQVSVLTDEGKRYQPDVVIDLPEGRCLVVDAKVSLRSYERYMSADTAEEKQHALREHLISVKKHISLLAEKQYQQIPSLEGLDFVLLFMPVESAFTLAIQQDAQLFTEAFEKNIVLVSPSTLLVTLRTIAMLWRQEYQSRNAAEIAKKAGDMYDKFVGFSGDLLQIGQKIRESQKAYDLAVNKLSTGNGNLVRRSEELKKLGAKTNKVLPEILASGESNDSAPLLA